MYHDVTGAVPEQDVASRADRSSTPEPDATRPLVLDLDGTLLRTDTLLESAIAALRDNPFVIFSMLLWLVQGRAVLKQRLAAIAMPDIATLPAEPRVVSLGREPLPPAGRWCWPPPRPSRSRRPSPSAFRSFPVSWPPTAGPI
ncbi:hypothetical protein BN1110_03031 [bacterium YEK0313]|nr:hypothetical protein BN1110_03031 [bacterium YEK0313]